MPTIFEELLAQNGAMPQPIASEPLSLSTQATSPSGSNVFEQLLQGNTAPTAQPSQSGFTPTSFEPESWWEKHGKTAEKAAAAGLILALGPLGLKAAGKLGRSTGVIGEAATTGVKSVQKILAPATVDEPAQQAAGLIREGTGTATRDVAKVEAKLLPHWRNIGNADDIDKAQFIDYVENRSKGAALKNPELQGLADELRQAYTDVHVGLGKLNATQKTGYIEDYYRHQWVRDEGGNYDRAFSKTGTAGFTKERKIPTIAEGMAKGLTPKSLDPIQTTLEYVDNARRFMASNEVIERGKKLGYIYGKNMGSKKPFPNTHDNWVRLEGALGTRGLHQLYAPEGFARVYNNWVQPGFTGAAGDVMHAARRTSNTITGLELGLSGFHMTTMINEAIINDVAKSIQQLAGGRGLEALGSLLKSPTAPIRLARIGGQLEKVYLGTERGTKHMRDITDLLARSGGRAAGSRHAKDYEYTAVGSFLQAWKRGALRAQAVASKQNIKNNPVMGTLREVGSLVGRTMQTVAEPIFNWYIPKLKNGAFYDTMSSWMKGNPLATKEEQIRAARDIWDSIDNRFGEMVQDNIFWRNHMKQVATLSMRSFSWTMGAIREIGGGTKDLATHQFTPRAAYAIALPAVYATVGAMYQYMKIGEAPVDTQDLIAPRTGGVDPVTGLPERMVMPGFMKDVFAWTGHPTEALIHKLATGVRLPIDLARNKDWRGAPIGPPSDPNAPYEETAPGWLKAYLEYVGTAMVPISIRELSKGTKVGSEVTLPEQIMGLRSGGRDYVDPSGSKDLKYYFGSREWQKKLQFDEKQKSLYEGYGGVE